MKLPATNYRLRRPISEPQRAPPVFAAEHISSRVLTTGVSRPVVSSRRPERSSAGIPDRLEPVTNILPPETPAACSGCSWFLGQNSPEEIFLGLDGTKRVSWVCTRHERPGPRGFIGDRWGLHQRHPSRSPATTPQPVCGHGDRRHYRGSSRCSGGPGNDELTGGDGMDLFYLGEPADTVLDYSAAEGDIQG